MTNNTFQRLDDARIAALDYSRRHPRAYVTIGSCFGWIVESHKRLNVHAPSDAKHWSGQTGTYWLNGKEKPFTTAQRVADQNATPTMS